MPPQPADYWERCVQDSRLPELEENLLSYLYTNAGALKLVSQVDTITQLLLEVITGQGVLSGRLE